ncbi:hypothetical protein MUK42_05939 [Musa troglodytarum]|uniref:Uncharacterized protein n=1 Tax=Musa troglodytarum TaxID=320322 RepID=A0A9E7JKX9_9LILI|nr:hypothetical protein MUK42_05939 [Musa troglodytarum]
MAASLQIRSHFLLLLLFVFIIAPQLSSCRPMKALDPSNDGQVLVPSPDTSRFCSTSSPGGLRRPRDRAQESTATTRTSGDDTTHAFAGKAIDLVKL